jgi:hypothetical protein
MPPEKNAHLRRNQLIMVLLAFDQISLPHLNTRSEMPSTNPPMCFYVLLSHNQILKTTSFLSLNNIKASSKTFYSHRIPHGIKKTLKTSQSKKNPQLI